MNNNFANVILAAIFLSGPSLALGQSNWERYEPRTLQQIVRVNCDPNMGHLQFSGKEFASIVEVINTGASRQIPSGRKQIILALKKVWNLPDHYINQFEREYLLSQTR